MLTCELLEQSWPPLSTSATASLEDQGLASQLCKEAVRSTLFGPATLPKGLDMVPPLRPQGDCGWMEQSLPL